MALPPLSSCLIAAGLLGLSIAIAQKARQPGLFGRWTMAALVVVGALLFGAGLAIHLRTPVPSAAVEVVRPATPITGAWSFSFEPKRVHWGEKVRLQIIPETEEVTVYFNDVPLPKKVIGKGMVGVTIPANSKSGYFTVDIKGTRVESKEQLAVSR